MNNMMRKESRYRTIRLIQTVVHKSVVLVSSVGLTAAVFLVLPLLQALNQPPSTDLIVQSMNTILDAPDPPPEPEPEPEEEPEEDPPPELVEEAPPLDLSQLELALNPGVSDGWLGGEFEVKLNTAVSQSTDVDSLFSIADLDQKPRAVYQTSPVLTKEVRAMAPGTVYIVFIVNEEGRVENPIIQNSTDPVFENPALNAIKKWKFEPGKRNGEPVRFRMRVPITFPKG